MSESAAGRAFDPSHTQQPAINNEQLENWFAHHTPLPSQHGKYDAIRNAARTLATIIRDNAPPSADTSTAIRKVREAAMTANAAIACDGR